MLDDMDDMDDMDGPCIMGGITDHIERLYLVHRESQAERISELFGTSDGTPCQFADTPSETRNQPKPPYWNFW